MLRCIESTFPPSVVSPPGQKGGTLPSRSQVPGFWASPERPQKITQKSACFWCHFSTDFRPQNGPQNGPKSSPRGPQDALGATLLLELVSGAILGSFLAPLVPRKSCSRRGAVLIFAKIAYGAWEPQNDPKTTPKWAQNRAPKEPQRPPDGPKTRSESVLHFEANFSSNFNDFWTPK